MRKPTLFEHVLLIDDDTTTNVINKRLLITQGFATRVTTAMGSKQAINYLTEKAAKNSTTTIDLILVDLKMGSKDGYWFLDKYHKKHDIAKAQLLVALTSSASFYDLERLKQYTDVITHIYKPLTANHLTDLAYRALAV